MCLLWYPGWRVPICWMGVEGKVTTFLDAEVTGCEISHESKVRGIPASRVSIDCSSRLNWTAEPWRTDFSGGRTERPLSRRLTADQRFGISASLVCRSLEGAPAGTADSTSRNWTPWEEPWCKRRSRMPGRYGNWPQMQQKCVEFLWVQLTVGPHKIIVKYVTSVFAWTSRR